MPNRESIFGEGGIELLKHLGAVGVTDSLMKVIDRISEHLAHSGALPTAAFALVGLTGAPLVWGVLLVGGCLLQCRRNHCSKGESEEQFRELHRMLAETKKAAADSQNMRGLLDGLLGQNIALREKLEKRAPFTDAFKAAADETAKHLGIDTAQFYEDVRIYLSDISMVLDSVKAGVDSLQESQAASLLEQRQADETTHELLNTILKRLPAKPDQSSVLSPQAIADMVKTNPEVREAVIAALNRGERLIAEGGADAAAAIDQVRQSGEVTKLEALLEKERSRRESALIEDAVEYAELCRELAGIAIIRGDSSKARILTEKRVRAFPENWGAVTTLGELLLLAGDSTGAVARFAKARAILDEALKGDPNNPWLLRDLAVSYNKIGDVLNEQGNGLAALGAYRNGLTIIQSLANRDQQSSEWRRDMAISHSKIGDVQLEQGHPNGALMDYRKTLAIIEDLVRGAQENVECQRDLSVINNKIGKTLLALGDGSGALEAYRKSSAIRERLAARDPENTQWLRDLSVSYERIGDVLREMGDLKGAFDAYCKDLAIAESLAARDPKNANWQRDLGLSHCKTGLILLRGGDRRAACQRFRKAQAIFKLLVALDPANATWRSDLSFTEAHIASACDCEPSV